MATGTHTLALVPAFHVDPATQLVHTPSAVVVAAVNPYPEGHVFIVTLPHVSLFVPALNVEPNTQLAHVASAVLSHDAVKYCPAGQVVFFAAQLATPLTPTLNSAKSQAVHVASALAEPAVKYCPAGQVVFLAAQTLTLMANTAEVPPLFVAVME
jgi:hypothetical protein